MSNSVKDFDTLREWFDSLTEEEQDEALLNATKSLALSQPKELPVRFGAIDAKKGRFGMEIELTDELKMLLMRNRHHKAFIAVAPPYYTSPLAKVDPETIVIEFVPRSLIEENEH